MLTPLAAEDPLAEMALGLVAESTGDRAAAAGHYQRTAERVTGTLAGAWSAQRYTQLTGKPAPVLPESARLQAMADGVPPIFDQMVANPASFMSLFVDTPSREIAYSDRSMVRLRLLNRSPVPLAVGAERPLNTRILLSSEISVGGVRSFAEAVPEVIGIDRRLRLMPREEINVEIWADPGFAGWALMHRTGEFVVRRYRALQGFMLDRAGVPRGGPNCLEAESSMPQTRNGLPRRTDEDWLASVGTARGEGFVETLMACRTRLASVGRDPKDSPMDATVASRMGEALLARYRREDRTGRLLILTNIPTGLQVAVLADLDRGLRDTPEPDPLVLLVKLVTRAVDDSDPGFAAAKGLSDPAIARAAAMVGACLKDDGVRGYSELTTFDTPGTGPQDP